MAVRAPAGDLAIELCGIAKSFGQVAAVSQCDLEVPSGSFVSILGPSGCGKTTLLRIIAGFESPDAGTVRIQDEDVGHLPPNKRNVNTVFQRYALFPHKTVLENVVFPLEVQGVPRKNRAERAREILELVRLTGFEGQSAATLSGGQAQRVALARALIGNPGVLLLDEPLAALDLKLRKAMQLELRRIQEQLGTTFLYVTHDQEEALTMSDTIVLMNDGEIAQIGTPADIYEHPVNLFASEFIGETNSIPVSVVEHVEALTRVESQGTFLTGPPSSLAVGSVATLAVRPERLRLAQSTTGDGDRNGLNVLDGRVERTVFLGNLVHVLVRTTQGWDLTVETGPGDSLCTAPGDPVRVVWRGEDSLLLERGE